MATRPAILPEIPDLWIPGLVRLDRENKTPRHRGWNERALKQYERAAAGAFDFELGRQQAQRWLEEEDAIGLCPPEGVLVVDCDSVEAVEWMESLAPDGTPIQKRHEGSAHFYFRYSEQRWPFKAWTQLVVGAGVLDLRLGGRSQVVVPPSPHRDKLRPYRWVEELPAELEHVPEVPDEIAQAIWDASPAARADGAREPVSVEEQAGFSRVRSYIGRLCRYESSREAVDSRSRAFAKEIFEGRPERLRQHLDRDQDRLVDHMWERWGGSNPLREMNTDEALASIVLASGVGEDWVVIDSRQPEFMRFEAGVWRRRSKAQLTHEVGQICHRLMEDAHRETGDPDRRERLTGLALALQSHPRTVRVVNRILGHLLRPAELFEETDPWLIPFTDGVLDAREGVFRELRREDLVTLTLGSRYEIEPEHEVVGRFLEQTFPDPELRSYLQEIAGVSLLGRVFEHHVFVFLYGRGKTGKSTFLEALVGAAGEFGRMCEFETFCEERGGRSGTAASPDVAALRWKRLAVCSEIPSGKTLGAKMKTLVGERYIYARPLFQDPINMRADFTVWVAGNVRPVADALDSGVERRLVVVPANQRVARVDPNLPVKLAQPGARRAMLSWMLEGLERVLARGGELAPQPPAVRSSAEEYWREMNPLDAFLEECCELEAGAVVSVADFTSALDSWGHESVGDAWHGMRRGRGGLDSKRIVALLEAHGVGRDYTRVGGKRARCFTDLRLSNMSKNEGLRI